ncbi:hypothetical protein OUZ56_017252 [Daphnia magna]|uniref:SNF2 N-terminal domain-containing protein n=1 Tax=Daphnia magna TaxID=35525 RepID=A0ABR0ASH2_9CRUS|nr:hypothetical protein OUZ56_017252 [Daphnia magna]
MRRSTRYTIKTVIVDVVVDSFLSRKLCPHQNDGVVFLCECLMGFKTPHIYGTIVADEMGLGKTLQCITFIWLVVKKPNKEQNSFVTPPLTSPVRESQKKIHVDKFFFFPREVFRRSLPWSTKITRDCNNMNGNKRGIPNPPAKHSFAIVKFHFPGNSYQFDIAPLGWLRKSGNRNTSYWPSEDKVRTSTQLVTLINKKAVVD